LKKSRGTKLLWEQQRMKTRRGSIKN